MPKPRLVILRIDCLNDRSGLLVLFIKDDCKCNIVILSKQECLIGKIPRERIVFLTEVVIEKELVAELLAKEITTHFVTISKRGDRKPRVGLLYVL